ncbi:MAG TPA: hypothetical protein DCE56_32800 [Cyanobacteria bacterium UBA8553]|nr:hypothetical protein [Cyanobacteria bacterium UBA8553]HAJ58760.1 hypothetical protein [Cyanobacteria bacterium UBA8543]
MVFPFIPLMAGGAVVSGSAVLAWYYSLSKEDKEKANQAVEDVLKETRSKLDEKLILLVLTRCSESLYGTRSINTLTPKQNEVVKKKSKEVITESKDTFEIAMELARKVRLKD